VHRRTATGPAQLGLAAERLGDQTHADGQQVEDADSDDRSDAEEYPEPQRAAPSRVPAVRATHVRQVDAEQGARRRHLDLTHRCGEAHPDDGGHEDGAEQDEQAPVQRRLLGHQTRADDQPGHGHGQGHRDGEEHVGDSAQSRSMTHAASLARRRRIRPSLDRGIRFPLRDDVRGVGSG